MRNTNDEPDTSDPLHLRAAPHADHATVLIAAARIGCDPRTARKAIERGVDAIRHAVHRERARQVLAELGLHPHAA